MAKINFPKKIKVAGFEYKIILEDKFNGSNVDGLHSFTQLIIYIRTTQHNPQYTLSVYMHEVVHAIDIVYCGRKLGENATDQLSKALYSFIVNNPKYNFSNSEIPKTVQIGDMKYTIKYPSDLKNEVSPKGLWLIDKSGLIINLDNTIHDMKVTPNVLKVALLTAIIECIKTEYNLDQYEEFDSLELDILAHGIYQVVVDNNLDNFLRRGLNKYFSDVKK